MLLDFHVDSHLNEPDRERLEKSLRNTLERIFEKPQNTPVMHRDNHIVFKGGNHLPLHAHPWRVPSTQWVCIGK